MPCFVSISVFFFFLLVTSFSSDVQPIKVVLGSYHTLILTGTMSHIYYLVAQNFDVLGGFGLDKN